VGRVGQRVCGGETLRKWGHVQEAAGGDGGTYRVWVVPVSKLPCGGANKRTNLGST